MMKLNPLRRTLCRLLLSAVALAGGGVPLLSIAAPAVDVWSITADKIDPQRYFGDTVANGMIGIVSSPKPFVAAKTMLNGVYDSAPQGVGNDVAVMLETFGLLNMELAIDGKTALPGRDAAYRQTMNFRYGTLMAEFNVGDKATVRYTWYALRQLPYAALADVSITAHQAISLSALSALRLPEGLKDGQHVVIRFRDAETPTPPTPLPVLTVQARTRTGRVTVAASTAFRFEGWTDIPEVTEQQADGGGTAIGFATSVPAGKTLRFALVGSTFTSAQKDNPRNESGRMTVVAALQHPDELIARHKQAWDVLWQSNIRIEGDDLLQRDVHSMLYHLYAFAREGASHSMSPMGLSGTGYNGHVFWDTETWMYPALLPLHPGIARSLLTYRTERLPAAQRNAVANGYRGAMFPWESAGTGDEETPLCCLSGPFEHHITADIGYVAWRYYLLTKDKDWLREQGWPLLKETADFWASRVERNGLGRFDIKGVVPADEWAGKVDNNAFTNAAAKANLQAAIDAARVLGRRPDPDWQRVRDNIPILKFPDGVTREHASYIGQPVKQADVNLLSYPLREITDLAAIRRDLDYYKAKIDVGPAMTRSIFAILHARLGEPEQALAEFRRGYEPNRRPPFGVLAETATNDEVYFATGAGGLIQALLYGFGGLDITSAGLVQRPTKLPKGWKSLTLTGIGPERKTFTVSGPR